MNIVRITTLVVLACGLQGCAQQLVNAAQKDCSSFGFAPGSSEYASCVQQQYAQRTNMMQAGLRQMGQTTSSQSQSVQPTSNGILQGQYVSGMSRICTYNRMGSPYVLTVKSTDLCPM